MNEKKQLIIRFFNVCQKLEEANVIRTTDYLGDIGEFIEKYIFKLTLNNSKRTERYDASDINDAKYEVKFHNGSNRNNIIISNCSICY